MESTSQEGASFVLIEFELGVDADLAAIDVKDKVESIQGELPDGVEPSSIHKFDIGAIPIMDIAISGNRPLEDLYHIADTTVKDTLSRVNGVSSVSIVGGKEREIQVLVNKAVERIRQHLPEGVRINVVQDTSIFIREAVRDVQTNLLLGIILTGLVLYIFLHNFRATFIVALAMPTSIIATFLLIDFAGFTLNIMSLMALGISVGILVANAIVVLENITRHIERGKSPPEAAKIGTAEVTIAVIASTLTNVMVFTPIGFMSGLVGQFFKQFGLTVVFATLFSLFVSFTLTPMLAARLLKSRVQVIKQSGNGVIRRSGRFSILQFIGWFARLPQKLFGAWEWAYTRLERGYRRGLTWTLHHRVWTILATILILIGSVALFRFIGVEFIPQADQGVIIANVEMPPGTSLEATDATLKQVERLVSKSQEVEAMLTTIGGSGQNSGVQLNPREGGHLVARRPKTQDIRGLE